MTNEAFIKRRLFLQEAFLPQAFLQEAFLPLAFFSEAFFLAGLFVVSPLALSLDYGCLYLVRTFFGCLLAVLLAQSVIGYLLSNGDFLGDQPI